MCGPGHECDFLMQRCIRCGRTDLELPDHPNTPCVPPPAPQSPPTITGLPEPINTAVILHAIGVLP